MPPGHGPAGQARTSPARRPQVGKAGRGDQVGLPLALRDFRRPQELALAAEPCDMATGIARELGRFLDRQAAALLAGKDVKGARAVYERSLALRQKTLGAKNPEVGESLVGLGNCAFEEGDLKMASWFRHYGRPFHVVLTKADIVWVTRSSRSRYSKLIGAVAAALLSYVPAPRNPRAAVRWVSSGCKTSAASCSFTNRDHGVSRLKLAIT